MKGLTKRQRELVDFLQEFIANNRYSPSYREIRERFGFSSLGSVHKHINALKRKGALDSEPGVSRSIALPELSLLVQQNTEIQIPLIGYLTSGQPIQMLPQTQQIVVPRTLIHSVEKTYAIKVQGDFLLEELIADGDVILVEVHREVNLGETVIALVNGQDTIIKKFYPEGDSIRLLSIYAQHHPILLREDDILIQGVVVGLIRSYG